MKRIGLWVAMGVTAVMAAGVADAHAAYGHITFVGAVVNDACHSAVPPLGMRGDVSRSAVRSPDAANGGIRGHRNAVHGTAKAK
jgi:hypothetical protein